MAKLAAVGTGGLLTVSRRVGSGEQGALLSCKNVHSKESGIYQQREGRTLSDAATFSNSYDRLFYDSINEVIWRGGSGVQGLQRYTTSWQSAIAGTEYAVAHQTLLGENYFLTDQGLRRLVSTTGLEAAGPPEALDSILAGSASPGWVQGPTQVSYKVVIGIKRSDGRIELGAPSGKCTWFTTGTSTYNPSIKIPVPREVTTSHFYQIYRTDETGSAEVQPDEYYYLIYENFFTSGQITARELTFEDTIPSGGGGQALYTNPDVFGATQANYPCESARDADNTGYLATFANCLFSATYKPRSSLDLSLLAVNVTDGLNLISATATSSVGSNVLTAVSASAFTNMVAGMRVYRLSGIPDGTTITSFNAGAQTVTMSANATAAATVTTYFGDTITIAGTTYYGAPVTSNTSLDFEINTNTSLTITDRISLTVQNLVYVINTTSANTAVYASYASEALSNPGDFYVWARTDRASSYTASSTRGQAFAPNITTAVTIPSIASQSVITFSREDRPYAFPPENQFILPNNAKVRGMVAVRSALIVLTDKGIFRILGTYGNFYVDALDLSVQAPNANPSFVGHASLNNVAFFRTVQGIVSVSDSGTELISGQVNNFISNASAYYGGLGVNPADGFLYVPLQYGILVYHTYQNIWTMYNGTCLTAEYNPKTQRVFFSLSDGVYYSEIAQSAQTFIDSSATAVTISSINTTTKIVTLSSPPSGFVSGDVIRQSGNDYIIKQISGAALTLEGLGSLTTGAAQLFKTVDSFLLYCPIGTPDPSLTKICRSANVIFDGALLAQSGLSASGETSFASSSQYKYVEFDVATDLDQTLRSVYRIADAPNYPHLVRTGVPFEAVRGSMFSFGIRIRGNVLSRIVGLEVDYEPVNERTRR